MSSSVEYHKPVFRDELVSRKKPSSLVFPADPRMRNPDNSTLVAGVLLVWGITKTGLLPLTDCSVVPLHGKATLQVGLPLTPPAAPMPIILSALRRVI